MLTHAQIWTAIDRLAAHAGLSPSGLAKRAGLDPTTFNKSKRITPGGRERWPSTESIAKSLAAAGVTPEAFVALFADAKTPAAQTVPMIGMAEAAAGAHFDPHGYPSGSGWDEIALPSAGDDRLYALEITDDTLQPVYRRGDVVIVSPASPVRRGDRVVMKARDGAVMIRLLARRTPKTVELQSLDGSDTSHAYPAEDVAWIARILWVSQ